MTAGGAFNDRARAAIYEAGGQRCVGCGRTNITAQHRRARGMGGTSDVTRGHPANGVPLCGSGTTGCHGWTEAHPIEGELLGWRLDPATPALGAPFYDRLYGWRAWAEDTTDLLTGTGDYERTIIVPVVVYVDETDLDRLEERLAALARYRAWAPAPAPAGKSQR